MRKKHSTLVLFALLACVPLLMGGCPEFRNEVISAANAATQGIVLGDQPVEEAIDTASRSFVSAVIDLMFDQLRGDSFR